MCKIGKYFANRFLKTDYLIKKQGIKISLKEWDFFDEEYCEVYEIKLQMKISGNKIYK